MVEKENTMNRKHISGAVGLMAILTLCATFLYAENIDPYEDDSQYAYGENVGWLNFEPDMLTANAGATVSDEKLAGYVWAENIGWINLGPNFGGVANDGTGLLSGYGWGENVGWISFNPKVPGDPNHYGVTIDHEGNFDGWAWGENIGWIHLASSEPVAYKVQTAWITSCVVDFDDLGRFCDLWLQTGPGLKADFDGSDEVDFKDYCTVAELWLRLCPAGWPLKD